MILPHINFTMWVWMRLWGRGCGVGEVWKCLKKKWNIKNNHVFFRGFFFFGSYFLYILYKNTHIKASAEQNIIIFLFFFIFPKGYTTLLPPFSCIIRSLCLLFFCLWVEFSFFLWIKTTQAPAKRTHTHTHYILTHTHSERKLGGWKRNEIY